MIIGAAFIFFGLALLVCLVLEPISNAFHIVFLRHKPYRTYDNSQKQKNLEQAKKTLSKVAIFMIVLGLVLLAGGYMIQYGSRGNGSLFSGNETEGVYQEDGGEESPIVEDGNGYEYIVTISGESIKVNEAEYTEDGFESFAKGIEETTSIYLEDDYAVSAVYHYVEDTLSNNENIIIHTSSDVESE
jgi:hypothetical protein